MFLDNVHTSAVGTRSYIRWHNLPTPNLASLDWCVIGSDIRNSKDWNYSVEVTSFSNMEVTTRGVDTLPHLTLYNIVTNVRVVSSIVGPVFFSEFIGIFTMQNHR